MHYLLETFPKCLMHEGGLQLLCRTVTETHFAMCSINLSLKPANDFAGYVAFPDRTETPTVGT